MRKVFWGLVPVLVIGLVLAILVPTAIHSYVAKRYPGVTTNDVSLRWRKLIFQNVVVGRDKLHGKAASVEVDWDLSGVQHVHVQGGFFLVDLDTNKDGPEVKAPESVEITGDDLTLVVMRGPLRVELFQANYSSIVGVCFMTGSVMYHEYKATISEGCISPRSKYVSVIHVESSIDLPFTVPATAPGPLPISLKEFRFYYGEKSGSFSEMTVGTLATLKEGKFNQDSIEASVIEVNHPWIASETATFEHIRVEKGQGPSECPSKTKVVATIEGAVVELQQDCAGNLKLQGSSSCNDWVQALPSPLPEALGQAAGYYKGRLSWEAEDLTSKEPSLKIQNECQFQCLAEPVASLIHAIRSNGKVSYQVYDKDNKLFSRDLGPKTRDWVHVEDLPSHVPNAFITLEDPSFMRHRGILAQALTNSLKANLEQGRFFRGGSTISMQLAKNLWLYRNKTLGRKAQEILLTIALESCLSKEEILAYYLNAVEFGPNLYGIGPASQAYFKHPAEFLSTEEAYYLASILPHPRKATPPNKGGLERTRRLMGLLAKRGKISPEELEAAQQEETTPTVSWEAAE